MTRLWVRGVAVRVEVSDGWPDRFRWDGTSHRVRWVANHWRVEVRWWRGIICRDYYRVLTDSGWLAVVYRDHLTDRWYLQRLYD